MSKYQLVSLGNHIDILSGCAFPSSGFNSDNGVPLIRIRDIISGETETYYDGDYDLKYLIKKGDLLVGMDGDFNREYWKGSDALLNQRVCKITPNSQTLDKSFLYHFLQRELDKIHAITDVVTVKHLSVKKIQNIKFELPPLKEQKRIATILNKSDGIHQKREQAIKMTDDYLRATFLEMFGDPVENPKGWKKMKFSEVGSLERGKSKHRPRNAPELLGGVHPLIQTGDVSNSGGYITEYFNTYSDLGLAQSKMWEKGTLCITIAANIAKTGILTFDACFPDSVVGFLPNQRVEAEFIQHWLGFLQKKLEENAPEVAQKNINLEILRNLDVIVPDKELQLKFKNIVKKIRKIKDEYYNLPNIQPNLSHFYFG
ncbi:restriction endonuclease subunit S [Pectobacterium carotovorum subsp. carotovorum]|uniref:restriction endonuclease subunit S n=1 Tax=Pectobacterium carotovorum TaxID=554 RepID=UPI002365374B|nr:restriction endonuclease subunit S [Pectobacterium carotovorum]WDF97738.1 restriction endonuclease subunit S [Pectobacterium carotovorum subsp. carotovorum]